jgi:hypothetical protein
LSAKRGFGAAWVGLALALAVHVTDEAANDFLSVYNPAVRAIRERIGFFPMPTFTFEIWITGLILAVLLLLSLSPFAFRASPGLRWVAYPLAVLMFFNGMGHILGSLYMRDWMPGVYSSPVLLAASVWLWLSLRRAAPSTNADRLGDRRPQRV